MYENFPFQTGNRFSCLWRNVQKNRNDPESKPTLLSVSFVFILMFFPPAAGFGFPQPPTTDNRHLVLIPYSLCRVRVRVRVGIVCVYLIFMLKT